MSLAELKENVMALPETERHDLVVWLNRLNYGDIPGEALAALAAEVWDQDDRHALPAARLSPLTPGLSGVILGREPAHPARKLCKKVIPKKRETGCRSLRA